MQKTNNHNALSLLWLKIVPLSFIGLIGSLSYISTAEALPDGGNITAGDANINQVNPNQLNINQTSDRAIIDWNSFSINQGETVNITQPSQTSAILNRVTGDMRSNIAGSLNANGQVMLVNPNGILFTKDANVNVGGLLSTTLDLTNTDFLNNNLNFFSVDGKAPATVENYGNITVAESGIAALVAPGVINNGVINVRLGKVILASGEKFTLDFRGDRLISIELDPVTAEKIKTADGISLTSLITNNGEIYNDGGIIQLNASTASNLINQAINMNGVIQAQSVANINGNIVLNGAGGDINVNGVIDASGQNQGETGGRIEVIAGNTLNVSDKSLLDASGYNAGGFVETSAPTVNIKGNSVTTASAIGNTGTWLLDPIDILIDDNYRNTVIIPALTNNNFEISTNVAGAGAGDITLASNVTFTTNNNSLTLTARRFNFTSGAFNISGNLIFNLNAVNPENIVPTSSINNAITAIGTTTIPQTTTINLTNGTSGSVIVQGDTVNFNKNANITLNGTGQTTTFLDGQNTRRVVDISAGNVTLNNLTVRNGNITGDGAGINITGNNITVNLNNATISNNKTTDANSHAGGINNIGNRLNIQNSIITGNSTDGYGGGIYNRFSATLNIANSTISGNTSVKNGGGIDNWSESTATINNSTISGNTSGASGGGVYNINDSTLNISNSTISGNQADFGGGIGNSNNSTLNITHATISNNSANLGGGIGNNNANVNLRNSIIANSINGGDVNASNINATGQNLVEDGTLTGANILNVDPLLSPLGNYGGLTQTHALLPGSPAINSGDNTSATGLTTDQRGVTRIIGTTVDLGAFEASSLTVKPVSGNGQSTNINTAFPSPLQVQIVDEAGKALSNFPINFIIQSTGASGTFTSANTLQTDLNGNALVNLTANNQEGQFSVLANIPSFDGIINVIPATFSLTNTKLPDVNEPKIEIPNIGIPFAAILRIDQPRFTLYYLNEIQGVGKPLAFINSRFFRLDQKYVNQIICVEDDLFKHQFLLPNCQDRFNYNQSAIIPFAQRN
jgi:filamentous hemagglutinin family protein